MILYLQLLAETFRLAGCGGESARCPATARQRTALFGRNDGIGRAQVAQIGRAVAGEGATQHRQRSRRSRAVSRERAWLIDRLLIVDYYIFCRLVVTLCWHLGGIATRFGSHLSRLDGKSGEKVNDLITSTFLEGSNSVSYLQNGFQLFVPILQFGAA